MRGWVRAGWVLVVAAAALSRVWNALRGPVLDGYDALGHVSYVFFLDLYRAIPYADQGWSYFHPPLHYGFGWLLAQSGSADVLVRGLALLGSAASLGVAALCARVVTLALPDRPALPLLAFTGLAFLPVHVYVSPMPGNEMTGTFFGAAAVVAFLASEQRPRSSIAGDAFTGVLAGLALLGKFSGLIPLAAIFAALALRAARSDAPGRSLLRAGARLGIIGGVTLGVAGGCYARNLAEFGTPFPLSREYPLVESVEQGQPPGSRSWRDFVAFSPKLLVDSDPQAAHMLHSVWGTVYASMWADTRREVAEDRARFATLLVTLGLFPTALSVGGFGLSLGAALRRRDSFIDATLVLLAVATLAAFAAFAWRVPIFSALKSSYLLNLSLPYGFFVARSVAAIASRGAAWPRLLAPLAVLGAAGVTAAVFTPGLLLARRADNPRMAAVRAYYGDYDRAASVYRSALAVATGGSDRPIWLREALAAVELEAGRTASALGLYRSTFHLTVQESPHVERRGSPWVANRLAVAAALDGDRSEARSLLDAALAAEAVPELLVNRGALRALAGDMAGAEADLRRALELDPQLAAAWHDLAWVLERQGDAPRAEAARVRAATLARRAPRGFPHGVGDGFHLNGQRFVLVLEPAGSGAPLALYRPARARVPPS